MDLLYNYRYTANAFNMDDQRVIGKQLLCNTSKTRPTFSNRH